MLDPRFHPHDGPDPGVPLWLIIVAALILSLGLAASSRGQIADPHQFAVQVATALPPGFGPVADTPAVAWLYAGSLDAVYVGRPCVWNDPGAPLYSQTHCGPVLLRRFEDAVRFRDLVSERFPDRETRLVRVWATRENR